ncbi:PE family protein (plasmid) [Mycobacterium sp. THAF192]|nr:PE family protein [Mycobacterium sp. THAF192]
MILRVNEMGLAQAGTRMIEQGVQGIAQSSAALAPATAISPAGVDEVSAFAAEGFAVHTTAMQTTNVVAQQEIALYGGVLLEASASYAASDAAGAAIVL